MKLIIILCIWHVITPANISAQRNNDSTQRYKLQTLDYNNLLEKSHKQQTTAIILGCVGGATAITGVVMALSEFKQGLFERNSPNSGNASEILAGGGLALIFAAIPFSLESRKNKKAALYIKEQNVRIVPGIKNSQLVSLGFKLNL